MDVTIPRTDMGITLDSLWLREEDLHPIRNDLFHSGKPGYHILKNFLNEEMTTHISDFWSQDVGLDPWFERFRDQNDFEFGCPNFRIPFDVTRESRIFFNFQWNYPADEATHAVSMLIHMLRIQLEARPIFTEIYPLEGKFGERAMYYMVVTSRRGTPIKPHSDWDTEEYYDPRRIYATLFLSERGVDYSGGGMSFVTNQGEKIIFGDDVEIHAGDLLIWKPSNIHAVEDIATTAGQLGFVRILFPPTYTPAELVRRRSPRLIDMQKRFELRLGKNRFVKKILPSVHRRMKSGAK